MRRNVMLKNREKQSSGKKKNRFLVSVNVLGSAGPIRFVVYEDDSVVSVIDTALRLYAREGRLPVLGSDVGDFLLYPVNGGSDCAMSASESIGLSGGRSFLLFKKQKQLQTTEVKSEMISKKGNSSWKALVALTDEIAKYGIPKGSRKINGKYIQSHLLFRLEAVLQRLKEQTKGVEAVQSKKVTLFWSGMAESVQVMGSFDGWSQGEHLSPEYTGSYTRFSSELMLRPGRYEIKFLVDGEWHLSPDLPLVGEGLMINNLLVVE